MEYNGNFNIPSWESFMIIDLIYPIGSIYMTVSDTNPFETIKFGVWEKIENRFLLASSNIHMNGETGGEENHTLTINEMPKHSHKMKYDSVGWTAIKQSSGTNGIVEYNKSSYDGQYSTEEVGNGNAHNNMPPYLAVNMWKRIA